MMLRPGWTRRVALRFIPDAITVTIIALRVAGALVLHWLSGVLPEPLAHLSGLASHAFALLACIAVFGATERAFAEHIYHGLRKLKEPHPCSAMYDEHMVTDLLLQAEAERKRHPAT
jgi:hypothetical protein